MKYLNRKAEAGLTLILVIIVAVLVFGWALNASQRECKKNSDCNSESYCGSDFQCHKYPNIQVVQYNFLGPAIIIGIAILLAALIIRWNRQQSQPETQEAPRTEEIVEVEDISEPYYKSDDGIKTP